MVYKFRYPIFPVDAQAAGEEIENIIKDCGVCDPSTVVDKSRPEDAVLHKCFEWDNEIAGEEWRRQRARVLVGGLIRVSVVENEPQTEVRAFVSVSYIQDDKEVEKNKYISIETGLADTEFRKQILERARQEMLSFKKKYYNLKEFDKLFALIDEIEVQLKMEE